MDQPETKETPAHKSRPRQERWSVETWVAVISFAVTFVGAGSVLRYQVGQLEQWRDKHVEQQDAAHATSDAKINRLQDDQRQSEASHDHRLTVLEERYSAILEALSRIERKISDDPRSAHR